MWRNCHILKFNETENLNESARLLMKSTLLALAIAAMLLAGLGQTIAAPNVTDLSVFGGRVAGTGDVKLSTGTEYHGKAVIRPTISGGGLAAKFKVTASVKVSGHTVPVSNEFTFTAAGKFLGGELAPGDTSSLRTKGKFTATGSGITANKNIVGYHQSAAVAPKTCTRPGGGTVPQIVIKKYIHTVVKTCNISATVHRIKNIVLKKKVGVGTTWGCADASTIEPVAFKNIPREAVVTVVDVNRAMKMIADETQVIGNA